MDMIKGKEKAVAAVVTGIVSILAAYGIDVPADAIPGITVVLSTAAVYIVPNSTK